MKKFSKVLSLLMAFVLVMGTVSVVSADMAFKDLDAKHWSYSYVQTLVGDGTINGYEDNTFRPNNNVTRAEFVKMIGKTTKSFEVPFDDIAGHWAYDYIMYSDMDVEGTSFRPNALMTREDVINLIWKRAGSPKAYAPGVVTKQSAYPDAAAWAYAYGIMTGDDGLSMRYQDGVTRAEAAALICRSRTVNESSKREFADIIDEKLLEEVYESFTFLGEYDPDKTFTNGEIASYSLQLLYENSSPVYDDFVVDFSVNRPHGLAFSAICNSFWGPDKMTVEYYDAKTTNLDAVALITFAIVNKSFTNLWSDVKVGDFYADVTGTGSSLFDEALSVAHYNGIRLDNTDNIYPTKELTGKSLALILLQCDMLGGFNTCYVNSLGVEFPLDTRIRTDIGSYPAKKDNYKLILDEIPNAVYNADFVDVDGSVVTALPKDLFRFARDQAELFAFSVDAYTYELYEDGVDAVITYYPSLVCETSTGYLMKVKVLINGYEEGKTFDQVFPNIIKTEKPKLEKGKIFYATLATGAKFDGTTISFDNAKFTTIDYVK